MACTVTSAQTANSATTLQPPGTVAPTPSPAPVQPPPGAAPTLQPPTTAAPQPLTTPQTLSQLGQPDAFTGINDGFATDSAALGATRESFSAAPTAIGDFFGGGLSAFGGVQRVNNSYILSGNLLSGGPGQANAILGFDLPPNLRPPDDLFTTGLGIDASGDGNPDTFALAEPLPTSDAPTSPGAGFLFDSSTGQAVFVGNGGGTAAANGIFTDGQQWFVSYDYIAPVTPDGVNGRGGLIPVPGPGVATRRIKIGENYSPVVRDRCTFNYSFFNDAYAGLGDISRYTLGMERILVDGLLSVEARLPLAGTYASNQDLLRGQQSDFEIGNTALILKSILLSTENLVWAAGMGVALPTADDSRLQRGGRNLLVVHNESVNLLPFSSVFYRVNDDFCVQSLIQVDVAANGNPIYGDLTGRSLPKLGEFTDSTLIALDVAATQTLYRSCGGCRHRRRGLSLQEVLLNTELHYTGTAQESDFVSSNGLTYTNLSRNFNILNATMGLHLVLSNNLVVTPAMSVPLRDGLDEQFDYEAIVQVNYLR
ncbi:hypothetical protein FYK55_11075 [Roseiconus nitratireducens]|uniref:Uncharacterized protein n=2 Tax=Roseiconus nitratireducens TaxID=2605748 RepID=A0A5M6DCU2_9BACT|nr:hypothetical protein FYK55_11075 [Roseiconus nitratireducens]